MAIYRVWAKMTTYCYLDVEAEDAYEANEIAEKTDGGNFIDDSDSDDWEIMEYQTERIR